MELRPGYKQTEVGVIPEEWEVSKGTEITTLIGKGASPRWQGFDYSNAGMLFITSENVRDGFLDVIKPKYLPLSFHDKLSRTKLRKGDILINLVGASIGRSCQITCELGEANVNQAVAVFRVNERHWSPFVSYYFQAPATIGRILDMQVDAARPNISLGDLRGFSIPVPTLPEQRAIAAALGDMDALLGALTRLIAKKRDLKQAAMQQLLTGQQRLPGFSGEWEVKRLGELAQIVSGGTPKTSVPAYWQGSIKWCTPTDITGCDGKYLTHTERSISREGLANCSARLLPAGSLMLCSRATIGEIRIASTEICTNQGFKSLICNRGVSNEFLYYMLLTMKSQMIEKAIGSTFLEISKKDAASLAIKLPQSEEQTAIATSLSDMDAELAALEARLAKTRALKQGMMQELLTGKTRLV